ncbi:Poly(U)-binding-splicing factor PUF60 [Fasciola gigantica]|uniref:Poly(U)-binding-splicing factor PUF60 n=1 Tax=Fasciola gigantica TaxID=46835 RepID=A0A504YWU3_FASGI|nr:Poly(U)-binding-splicing factor PUF60 [Fasciola gigantica]
MFALNTPAPVSALNLLNLSTIVEPNGPVYNGPGATKHFTPFHLRQLEYHQREAIERAKKYAMEQSIRAVLLKQTQSQQSQQLDNMKKNQTVALLNRVYVGSISYDVKEEMLKQSFSVFGPIKTVSMSWDPATQKHKGFAFLEFEYPEGAHLAIEQMNGTSFGGRQLKVGRPSNLASADPIIAELVAEYKLENRIYVSGIHLDLTEDDVSLVFEAFGKIVFCRLQPDPSRPIGHRGFGYIEYENGQSAMDAVASMNQFELGGQLLPPKYLPSEYVDDDVTLESSNLLRIVKDNNHRGKNKLPVNTAGIYSSNDTDPAGSLVRPTESIVSPATLPSEQSPGGFRACSTRPVWSSYRVIIHQEVDPETNTGCVKVFVQFVDQQSVGLAIEALHGRFFAGRQITAEPYDIQAFLMNDYSL